MNTCKYGDPVCPCQDGDTCHYEGENPMRPADIIVRPDFKHLGFVTVTATTENAQKWLGGSGPFSYEAPEWKRAEREAKSSGFTIQRTV